MRSWQACALTGCNCTATKRPERVAAIRQRLGLRVMKALPVATHADLAPVRRYAGVADRLLFDAQPPRDATSARAGSGRRSTGIFWNSLIRACPFMLSGGLNAENVAEGAANHARGGVDVSSGVERAPGEKDPDKIRAFIRATRLAAAAMESCKQGDE